MRPNMQPIDSPPCPFHTITLDFILALPRSAKGYDAIMSVTVKLTKRISFIADVTTFNAKEWAIKLLKRPDKADWGLPKAIISDRDPKFLSEVWKTIFDALDVKLLYSTAYHPQTDGQSERTNQTTEIKMPPMVWPWKTIIS